MKKPEENAIEVPKVDMVKVKASANQLHESLTEYSFLTSGDPGAEAMASTAFAVSMALYAQCGIEGEKLLNRVKAMTAFYIFLESNIKEQVDTN